jgi:anti-sigma factor RsiW
MSEHLSIFALGRFAHGASPPKERQGAEEHLSACPACQARLAEVNESRERFSRGVFERTLPEVRRRDQRRRRLWAWAVSMPLVLAAGVASVLVMRQDREPDFGFKGAPTLQIFVRRGEKAVDVAPGSALHAGDQLRLAIDPSGYRYLLVGSVDASGKASIYVPFEGSRSVPISQPTTFPASGSLVLDDTPGPERLFALLSRSPIDADPVLAALRELGRGGPAAIRATQRLPLPAGAQVSFLWEKGGP